MHFSATETELKLPLPKFVGLDRGARQRTMINTLRLVLLITNCRGLVATISRFCKKKKKKQFALEEDGNFKGLKPAYKSTHLFLTFW